MAVKRHPIYDLEASKMGIFKSPIPKGGYRRSKVAQASDL